MLSTCAVSPKAYVTLVVCERVLHNDHRLTFVVHVVCLCDCYSRLSPVCERVHDGHCSIFVVVHAGPSPAKGLGGA